MPDSDPAITAVQQAIYRADENVEDAERATRSRHELVVKAKNELTKAEAEHERSARLLREYRAERDSLKWSLDLLQKASEG